MQASQWWMVVGLLHKVEAPETATVTATATALRSPLRIRPHALSAAQMNIHP
jgi:hypothetical protein